MIFFGESVLFCDGVCDLEFCEGHECGSFGLTVRVVILGASIGDQVTVFKSILSRKSYYSKLLTLYVGVLLVFEGRIRTQYLNFRTMGSIKKRGPYFLI